MEFTKLTPQQHQQFNEEGYLIVRNALDEKTIARLIKIGDRLCASSLSEGRQSTSDGLYDGFRNCIALDDEFMPLMTHPKTLPLIVQLFGPRIHLITSHLIYKHCDAPGTPATTRSPGWHRDIANTPADLGHAHIPRMEMKCAFYLTDLSCPNWGATLFSPGSNHLKQPLAIAPGACDPENVLEPLLEPGDAVFFENRTWHAASVNWSGHTRKAVMFGYGFGWLKPMDYKTQPRRLTEKLNPIEQQLLGALETPEGKFQSTGLYEPLQNWCEEHEVNYQPPG
jgi:ectoine hydroxylase-related dioxygenase (phytanoyl-CoA dioxygenase family)